MKLRWGYLTDTGMVREANEDRILAERPVFAVADGMGGHAAGEVASHIAVDTLARSFGADHPPTVDGLVGAVQMANRTMVRQSLDVPHLRGMGTTLCGLAVIGAGDEERIVVFNVGDSRVYRLRAGHLERLTTDHSYVQELVEAGEITPAEARVHPHRNIVTRALGMEDDIAVDTWEEEPVAGDRYLLCSDGLVDELDDDGIESVLSLTADPQAAAEELTRRANEAGGHDNVSVVVVDVVATGAAESSSGKGAEPDRPDETAPTGQHEAVGAWLGDTQPPLDADPVAAPTSPPEPEALAPARRRRRLAGALILLVALLVVGAAFGAIQYYGKASYYVGFSGDQVAVYQGRPGGVLWIDPTVATTYPLTRTDLTELGLQRVDQNATFSSRQAAERYVSNLSEDPTAIVPTTTTTSTTTTTVPRPTTTAPVATTPAPPRTAAPAPPST